MSDWVKRLCIIIKTRPKTRLNSATEGALLYPSLLRTQCFTVVLFRKINSPVTCIKSYIDVHVAPSGKKIKWFQLVISVLMTQSGELMTSCLSEMCQITRNKEISWYLCALWNGYTIYVCMYVCMYVCIYLFMVARMRIVFWTQFSEVKYFPCCLTLTGYLQFVAIY